MKLSSYQIVKIVKEEPFKPNPFDTQVEAALVVDSKKGVLTITETFGLGEWQQAKKQGYFIA